MFHVVLFAVTRKDGTARRLTTLSLLRATQPSDPQPRVAACCWWLVVDSYCCCVFGTIFSTFFPILDNG